MLNLNVMEIIKKFNELITQKYYPLISIIGNYKKDKNIIIHNTVSDVAFEAFEDSLYKFKDEEKNFWMTIPKKIIINDKRFYPVVGNVLTCDGVKYRFTTKEIVIEMASAYFKKFIDPHYGIQTIVHGLSFFENSDDKTDRYWVVFQKFKSLKHNQIEAFISSN